MDRSAFVVGPFARGSQHRTTFPYGAEHLARHGYAVTYVDPTRSRPWSSAPTRFLVKALHRLLRAPVLDSVLEPGRLHRADLVVCFLEGNLAVLAPVLRVLRCGRRRDRTVLVVVWLADQVGSMSAGQRRRWRRRLQSFGRVVVFSANQVGILETGLDLPAGLVVVVPFGVAPLTATPAGDARDVLTVGVDVGRDFPTFVAALDDSDVRATVVTNAELRASLGETGSVDVVGPLTREGYLEMLDRAGIVVSVTKALAYPGGQTTLIEAMQRGRACVVTRTEAIGDYVTDEVDVLMVEPGDSTGLRRAVERLRDDACLRARLGSAASVSGARFTEAAMWSSIQAQVPGAPRGAP